MGASRKLGLMGTDGSEYGPVRDGARETRIVLPVGQYKVGYASSFNMAKYCSPTRRMITSIVPMFQSNSLTGGSENDFKSLDSTYSVRWLAQYLSASSGVPSRCGVCHVSMY